MYILAYDQRSRKLNTNESKKEKRGGGGGAVIAKYSYKDNSPVYSSLHCRAAISVAILSGNYSTHRRNTRSNHPATPSGTRTCLLPSLSPSLSLPLHHHWTCISGNYANRGSSINRHYWRLNRSVDRWLLPSKSWFRLIFRIDWILERLINERFKISRLTPMYMNVYNRPLFLHVYTFM